MITDSFFFCYTCLMSKIKSDIFYCHKQVKLKNRFLQICFTPRCRQMYLEDSNPARGTVYRNHNFLHTKCQNVAITPHVQRQRLQTIKIPKIRIHRIMSIIWKLYKKSIKKRNFLATIEQGYLSAWDHNCTN